MPEVRKCMVCGKAMKGRSDKKFCSDLCRNTYNNKLKSASNPYIRNLNDFLKKNHQVLQEILTGSAKPVTVSKEKLQRLGFRFKYHTHTYTTKKGAVYFYCYDYGYLPLDSGAYLVVRENTDNPPILQEAQKKVPEPVYKNLAPALR